MSDYFQHTANKGRARKEVAVEVIEFTPVDLPGAIEVHEHTEGTGEFRKLFAELMEQRT